MGDFELHAGAVAVFVPFTCTRVPSATPHPSVPSSITSAPYFDSSEAYERVSPSVSAVESPTRRILMDSPVAGGDLTTTMGVDGMATASETVPARTTATVPATRADAGMAAL